MTLNPASCLVLVGALHVSSTISCLRKGAEHQDWNLLPALISPLKPDFAAKGLLRAEAPVPHPLGSVQGPPGQGWLQSHPQKLKQAEAKQSKQPYASGTHRLCVQQRGK